MDIGGYQIHPLADAFPLIEGEAFDELVADIAKNGQIHPITLWNGSVLDGRNRLRACLAAGVTPIFEEIEATDEQARDYVVATNLRRRHLTESQRAMVAARLVLGPPGSTVGDAAEALSVSARSIHSARAVLKSGDTNVVQLVERGAMSVRKAEAVATGKLTIDEASRDGRRERKSPPAVRRLVGAIDKLMSCEAQTDKLVKGWPGDIDLDRVILFLRTLKARTQEGRRETAVA